MIVTDYNDALQNLHIVEMAYRLEEYSESAVILKGMVFFIISDQAKKLLTPVQYQEIYKRTKNVLAEFSQCPDEALWEDMSQLYSDLFRDDV